MKTELLFIILISILISCKDTAKSKPNKETNKSDNLIKRIDSLYNNGYLIKYFHPDMSHCGGAVYGYYENEKLVLIDSEYGAELGFSSRKVYWDNNKILKIVYREYFPEWDKYEKSYPSDKFEFDSEKMTYSDTIYEISFGQDINVRKHSGKNFITNKIDSILIKELMECGHTMMRELETEKIKK